MVAGNTTDSAETATAMEASFSPAEGQQPALTPEDATAKAIHKRYEGLLMVRNKAVRGKGAWYWAHLEPLLVQSSETGLPKAVKLKCCLCETLFSASNPSRTASEHLKRGTCPNFSSSSLPPSATSPRPISSVSPNSIPPPLESPANHRKRSSSSAAVPSSSSYNVSPLAIIDPSRYCHEMAYSPTPIQTLVSSTAVMVAGGSGVSGSTPYSHHRHHHHQQQQHLMLSGGKEDLGPLAMLEDSVKRLRSPKTSPGPPLSKTQIEFALDCLADWVYESFGSVSFSCLEHPKFKLFLNQVGLPGVSRRDLSGSRLDSKYKEAKSEAEARIRDAMFFQIASDGWKPKRSGSSGLIISDENLVNLTVNLPNGTSVFRRGVFTGGGGQLVPSKYAEEVLWETIGDVCSGRSVQQCVGIVADRFKNKALWNLESQHQWMVNLCCQYQGVMSLIKDLYKELPLFVNVAQSCRKVASFVNNKTHVRSSFRKHQLQEYGVSGLLKLPSNEDARVGFEAVFAMVEDILGSARALQGLLMDESYKVVSMEDPEAREFGEMVRDVGFWNDLEAVRFIVKAIKDMAHEIESERPLVGQCLPLWEELRSKFRSWCVKFHISEGVVEKIVERRFKKNYHPAWATAYILDPLYLMRDSSGKYLPPFKNLTPQQEKDVDKLITRLVSKEEAHIALMELMKWRAEGLDPVYAQAVQLKQRDPITGKLKIANPQSSRLVWETYLTEFKVLGKVAVRLIFLHATSRGFKCNPAFLRWIQALGNSRAGVDKAQKIIFIAANSKLERRDFTTEEEKDAELFTASTNGDQDDVLNEVFADTSSM